MFDGGAVPNLKETWAAADKGCFQCDCRVPWSCNIKQAATSAERLWEAQTCGADVKHTVTEGRQSERQGYCQSLTAAQNWKKQHTAPATENEMMEERESILLFEEKEFIFQDQGLKCETSARRIKSNQTWSKTSHLWERNCISW